MAQNHTVTSEDYPYLPIRISIRGWQHEALALLDTGFTGELIIPGDVLPQQIGIPDGFMDFRVADDRIASSPMFIGDVEIGDLPTISDIAIGALGSKYIVGREILDRYRIILDRGERVIIEL